MTTVSSKQTINQSTNNVCSALAETQLATPEKPIHRLQHEPNTELQFNSAFQMILSTLLGCQTWQSVYLAWLLLPADLYAWPDTAPHHIMPQSWPLPPTAGSRNSTSQRRILKGHVNDRGHRTCNTNRLVKRGRK